MTSLKESVKLTSQLGLMDILSSKDSLGLLQKSFKDNSFFLPSMDAIQKALEQGKRKEVAEILRNSPWVLDKSDHGITSLIYAAFKGNADMIKLFIALGSDLNFQTNDKQTALIIAAISGHQTVVHELIQAGANLNLQDQYGLTALAWASYFDKIEVVKMLIQAGADLNLQNQLGSTPLWLAASKENMAVVQALIDAGADLNVLNNDNESVFDLAKHSSKLQNFFNLQHHSSMNTQLSTPLESDLSLAHSEKFLHRLFVAIVNNDLSWAEFLLKEYSFDLNDLNEYQGHYSTPLLAATYHSKIDFIQLFLNHGAQLNPHVLPNATSKHLNKPLNSKKNNKESDPFELSPIFLAADDKVTVETFEFILSKNPVLFYSNKNKLDVKLNDQIKQSSQKARTKKDLLEQFMDNYNLEQALSAYSSQNVSRPETDLDDNSSIVVDQKEESVSSSEDVQFLKEMSSSDPTKIEDWRQKIASGRPMVMIKVLQEIQEAASSSSIEVDQWSSLTISLAEGLQKSGLSKQDLLHLMEEHASNFLKPYSFNASDRLASPDQCDQKGSILDVALTFHDPDQVAFWVNAFGPDWSLNPQTSPLKQAILMNEPVLIDFLLKEGASSLPLDSSSNPVTHLIQKDFPDLALRILSSGVSFEGISIADFNHLRLSIDEFQRKTFIQAISSRLQSNEPRQVAQSILSLNDLFAANWIKPQELSEFIPLIQQAYEKSGDSLKNELKKQSSVHIHDFTLTDPNYLFDHLGISSSSVSLVERAAFKGDMEYLRFYAATGLSFLPGSQDIAGSIDWALAGSKLDSAHFLAGLHQSSSLSFNPLKPVHLSQALQHQNKDQLLFLTTNPEFSKAILYLNSAEQRQLTQFLNQSSEWTVSVCESLESGDPQQIYQALKLILTLSQTSFVKDFNRWDSLEHSLIQLQSHHPDVYTTFFGSYPALNATPSVSKVFEEIHLDRLSSKNVLLNSINVYHHCIDYHLEAPLPFFQRALGFNFTLPYDQDLSQDKNIVARFVDTNFLRASKSLSKVGFSKFNLNDNDLDHVVKTLLDQSQSTDPLAFGLLGDMIDQQLFTNKGSSAISTMILAMPQEEVVQLVQQLVHQGLIFDHPQLIQGLISDKNRSSSNEKLLLKLQAESSIQDIILQQIIEHQRFDLLGLIAPKSVKPEHLQKQLQKDSSSCWALLPYMDWAQSFHSVLEENASNPSTFMQFVQFKKALMTDDIETIKKFLKKPLLFHALNQHSLVSETIDKLLSFQSIELNQTILESEWSSIFQKNQFLLKKMITYFMDQDRPQEVRSLMESIDPEIFQLHDHEKEPWISFLSHHFDLNFMIALDQKTQFKLFSDDVIIKELSENNMNASSAVRKNVLIELFMNRLNYPEYLENWPASSSIIFLSKGLNKSQQQWATHNAFFNKIYPHLSTDQQQQFYEIFITKQPASFWSQHVEMSMIYFIKSSQEASSTSSIDFLKPLFEQKNLSQLVELLPPDSREPFAQLGQRMAVLFNDVHLFHQIQQWIPSETDSEAFKWSCSTLNNLPLFRELLCFASSETKKEGLDALTKTFLSTSEPYRAKFSNGEDFNSKHMTMEKVVSLLNSLMNDVQEKPKDFNHCLDQPSFDQVTPFFLDLFRSSESHSFYQNHFVEDASYYSRKEFNKIKGLAALYSFPSDLSIEQTLTQYPSLYPHAPADVRNSLDVAKLVLNQDGASLQHAGPLVQYDIASCFLACNQNKKALEFIPTFLSEALELNEDNALDELKSDVEVLKEKPGLNLFKAFKFQRVKKIQDLAMEKAQSEFQREKDNKTIDFTRLTDSIDRCDLREPYASKMNLLMKTIYNVYHRFNLHPNFNQTVAYDLRRIVEKNLPDLLMEYSSTLKNHRDLFDPDTRTTPNKLLEKSIHDTLTTVHLITLRLDESARFALKSESELLAHKASMSQLFQTQKMIESNQTALEIQQEENDQKEQVTLSKKTGPSF